MVITTIISPFCPSTFGVIFFYKINGLPSDDTHVSHVNNGKQYINDGDSTTSKHLLIFFYINARIYLCIDSIFMNIQINPTNLC